MAPSAETPTHVILHQLPPPRLPVLLLPMELNDEAVSHVSRWMPPINLEPNKVALPLPRDAASTVLASTIGFRDDLASARTPPWARMRWTTNRDTRDVCATRERKGPNSTGNRSPQWSNDLVPCTRTSEFNSKSVRGHLCIAVRPWRSVGVDSKRSQ